MKTYKITFSHGDTIITSMNASLIEAREYYLNHWFNFGDTEERPRDLMATGIMVEEI